jgi:hypothetical protein
MRLSKIGAVFDKNELATALSHGISPVPTIYAEDQEQQNIDMFGGAGRLGEFGSGRFRRGSGYQNSRSDRGEI